MIANCPPEEIDGLICRERDSAAAGGYTLEWKHYGHDAPEDLPERLVAAGFVPADEEEVLVLALDEASLAAFDDAGRHEIKIVRDEGSLADYAEISREIGRRNAEEERLALALQVQAGTDEMSIHIAYADGEPVACGRVYFRDGGTYAELSGGRTKTAHRRQGHFTSLVASRLRESRDRGRTHAFVDALPTSAPILRKLGFQFVTRTRPFVFVSDSHGIDG
ncbi:GNAT family N-acetyltransferase [Paenibacillus rhizovicinus]|uniref:GNAT family N-acetyltransferase n=1 Tax=Paenibacillus rhizovicinus TaxID=2704463 RepID=A0A6C0P8I7_9BACL|nr:GNAT family N-acetyltransferase [Paenibacillus rhizovicinus]